MRILAIETSCDDTCVAVVEADKRGLQRGYRRMKFNILSNIVSSQVKIHKKWGGVYPTLAKREHQKNLTPVLQKALNDAKMLKSSKSKVQNSKFKIQNLERILEREPGLLKNLIIAFKKYQRPKIDLIAVTIGPGLEPCLWTGVNFAKALAYFWNLPIVPVNHLEAHILANWLPPIGEKSQIPNSKFQTKSKIQIPNSKNLFPAICLVVSGGHTQLILMKDFGKYKVLGETRDDAAGECFDKVARILGLGYPGGPIISQWAAKLKSKVKSQKSKVILPRPMIYQKNYDFSFSGLKTAVLYKVRSLKSEETKRKRFIQEICKETQQAVIDVLIHKTLRAVKEYKAKTLILGGGVAANDELRKQFYFRLQTSDFRLQFLVPPKILCTDNAVMTAMAGYYNYLQGKIRKPERIKAKANLRIEH